LKKQLVCGTSTVTRASSPVLATPTTGDLNYLTQQSEQKTSGHRANEAFDRFQ
jgi:hypothetical protein